MAANDERFTDYDLMVRIAWLYYIDHMTQHDIAKQYGITRIKVQRILRDAEQNNIITISIQNPFYNLLHIERDIIDRFGLRDAVVVPSQGLHLEQDLAKAGAIYLSRKLLSNVKSIGIGAGRTLSHLGASFATIFQEKTENIPYVVSLQGVLSHDATWSSMDNGQSVAQAIGAPFFGIWAPCSAQTVDDVELLKNQKMIKNALEMANDAEVKVISVGSIDEHGFLYSTNVLDSFDVQLLKSKGVCGEILLHLYDSNGNMLDDDLSRRSISVDIPIQKGVVICIAGGKHKHASIKAVLQGKQISVLITDYDTAQYLLE